MENAPFPRKRGVRSWIGQGFYIKIPASMFSADAAPVVR